MRQSPHRATPLQHRMTHLSAYLVGGAVALCAVVLVSGVLHGQSFEPMLLTAREAVAQCRSAGIAVALVTGDHPGTAAAIAGSVGIDGS